MVNQQKFVFCPQTMHDDSKKTFVLKYTLLSSCNHMDINPNSLFDLVHDHSLRFHKLTHVNYIMTQTHHAQTPLLCCLSPRYQLSDTATSAVTSKEFLIFHTVIMNLVTRTFVQHSRSRTGQIQYSFFDIELPLFSLLSFIILDCRITVGLTSLVM